MERLGQYSALICRAHAHLFYRLRHRRPHCIRFHHSHQRWLREPGLQVQVAFNGSLLDMLIISHSFDLHTTSAPSGSSTSADRTFTPRTPRSSHSTAPHLHGLFPPLSTRFTCIGRPFESNCMRSCSWGAGVPHVYSSELFLASFNHATSLKPFFFSVACIRQLPLPLPKGYVWRLRCEYLLATM